MSNILIGEATVKLVLEALEQLDGIDTETECVTIDVGDAITALREALAEQPAQQEPVTDEENEKFSRDVSNFKGTDEGATMYALERFLKNRTAPQPAQPERHELQAKGEHPAPCARHCEATAFRIVIRNLKAQLAQPAVQQEPVADRAFLERVLAAMENVIDVADRKTNEFDSLRACIVDLTLMLHSPQTAQPAPVQDPAEHPTNEELEDLWHGSHFGHPADFAADVLERWGGAPSGLMGHGGSLNKPAAPQPAQQELTNIERHERNLQKFLAEQPAQQEPVARQYQSRDGVWKDFISEKHYKDTLEDGSWSIRNLYTSPPAQRKPLTVHEIAEFVGTHEYGPEQLKWFRLGEAAHGIKENT
jgi:hypothetical protein